jgi:hypothetical protein
VFYAPLYLLIISRSAAVLISSSLGASELPSRSVLLLCPLSLSPESSLVVAGLCFFSKSLCTFGMHLTLLLGVAISRDRFRVEGPGEEAPGKHPDLNCMSMNPLSPHLLSEPRNPAFFTLWLSCGSTCGMHASTRAEEALLRIHLSVTCFHTAKLVKKHF